MKETKNVSVEFAESSSKLSGSDFSDLIEWAFTTQRFEVARWAYLFLSNGIYDTNFVINLPISKEGMDIELMERVVRFLVRNLWESKRLKRIVFRVRNAPEEVREYVSWFIPFFGYLESSAIITDLTIDPQFNREEYDKYFRSKFVPYTFDPNAVHPLHDYIEVIYID